MTIQTRLLALGLRVPSEEKIAALSGNPRVDLFRHIVFAEDGHTNSLNYLETLFKCSSDFCVKHLQDAGIDIEIRELTDLALTEDKKFFRAVNALSHGGDIANEAREYLIDVAKRLSSKNSTKQGVTSEPTFNSDSSVPQVNEKPKYDSYHVYSSKWVLCFSIGVAADGTTSVINIDGAPAIATKVFDWKNKIAFQLNSEEIFRLLAVLQIKLSRVEFNAHGKNNDKSFSMVAQLDKGSYYAVLVHGRRSLPMPVPAAAGLLLSSMLIKAILRNAPHLNEKSIDELLLPLVRLSSPKDRIHND